MVWWMKNGYFYQIQMLKHFYHNPLIQLTKATENKSVNGKYKDNTHK